jgi:hypothetical protein
VSNRDQRRGVTSPRAAPSPSRWRLLIGSVRAWRSPCFRRGVGLSTRRRRSCVSVWDVRKCPWRIRPDMVRWQGTRVNARPSSVPAEEKWSRLVASGRPSVQAVAWTSRLRLPVRSVPLSASAGRCCGCGAAACPDSATGRQVHR